MVPISLEKKKRTSIYVQPTASGHVTQHEDTLLASKPETLVAVLNEKRNWPGMHWGVSHKLGDCSLALTSMGYEENQART